MKQIYKVLCWIDSRLHRIGYPGGQFCIFAWDGLKRYTSENDYAEFWNFVDRHDR